MDLKTVERKVKSHLYKTFEDFDADLTKIIQNSYIFNKPDTVYHGITNQFETLYKGLCHELVNKPQCFDITQKER